MNQVLELLKPKIVDMMAAAKELKTLKDIAFRKFEWRIPTSDDIFVKDKRFNNLEDPLLIGMLKEAPDELIAWCYKTSSETAVQKFLDLSNEEMHEVWKRVKTGENSEEIIIKPHETKVKLESSEDDDDSCVMLLHTPVI